MKTKTFFLLVLFVTVSVATTFAQNKKKYVEVVYFHRTNRCSTCNAIEKVINEVIEKDYAKELKSGAITFFSIDFQAENPNELVAKHEIDGPTLLIIYHKKSKETVSNLTDEAFDYARSQPDKFKKALVDNINECFR
jgi:hypothetical protein